MRRLTKGFWGLCFLALSIIGAHAQTPPTPPTLSIITGSASLAVTTTSARVLLPNPIATSPVATITNTGSVVAYVLRGSS